MFSKVYMVFDNEHLMNRDKTDFKALWTLTDLDGSVEYRLRREFVPEENSLVLVDESDTLMFESPQRFADLIESKFCICFTATPNSCDERGVEAQVIAALGFKHYKYVVNEPLVDLATQLQFDEVNQATTAVQKVEYIKNLLTQGSVLLYGPQELYEALKDAIDVTALITNDIDPQSLR